MAVGSWQFDHNSGPRLCMFNGADLKDHIDSGGTRVFRNVVFTDCDFQGYFQDSAQLVFDSCHFLGCDFGLTTWTNVKFSKCNFKSVSFGQTKLNNCEFRACAWERIGLSPNGTELNSTYVSNASALINAAFTNLDINILQSHNVDYNQQKYRLEHTKATVARRLLKLLQQEGDEEAFYDAVKTFQLQHASSMAAHAKGVIRTNSFFSASGSLAFITVLRWQLERVLLEVIGALNDWGASVMKPILASLVSLFIFGILYHTFCSPTKLASAFQRSYDIAMLAGYTNYGSESDSITILVQNVQLLISIVLYSVTFATIVNRLSRVR
jgi:hypothetical protein